MDCKDTKEASTKLAAGAGATEGGKKRTRVARVEEFKPGKPILVAAGRREIGVFRVGDEFCAVLNFCPHEGIKICSGRVEGTYATGKVGEFKPERAGQILSCPWHGWQFDLQSGVSVHDAGCRLKTYETEVENGVVWVRA